ncbi:MAG: hypothetical protein PHO74_08565, partial [Weeksellaceae bacterium]|nr:hypothetical protein [Weeksellaceae bacterium]
VTEKKPYETGVSKSAKPYTPDNKPRPKNPLLRPRQMKGRTLTLKIKYEDFSVFTRSKTEVDFFYEKDKMFNLAKFLWEQRPYYKAVRLLGLSMSNLNTEKKKQFSIQLKIPFREFRF